MLPDVAFRAAYFMEGEYPELTNELTEAIDEAAAGWRPLLEGLTADQQFAIVWAAGAYWVAAHPEVGVRMCEMEAFLQERCRVGDQPKG